jgi:tetratricopeptide (TPR) repeat protein
VKALGIVIGLVLALGVARAELPLDELGSDDPAAVAAAVAAIEAAPASEPELADALFAAARACEDTLLDPARAVALYDRIVAEFPDARVALAARRRALGLRAQVGGEGEHAARAAELAQLVAGADELAADAIERRAAALAEAEWPGAADAALWLAEWLRRIRRLDEADARYATVVERWPGSPQAVLALRGAAGAALEARRWDRAEELAARLPDVEPADRIVRADVLDAAARGRRRARWYALAWGIAIAGFVALAGSLAESALRGGRRWPKLAPPLEVVFLAPVAAVLVGVALTTHQLIAPAVLGLTAGGLGLAYLSGCTLDTLRARGRPVRRRALAHGLIAAIAVAAIFYIVIMRDDLLDMVIETVRFGPDP